MIAELTLASILACSSAPLSLKHAETLVLAAPQIRASVAERGARPFFAWVHRDGPGWRFDVNARNPCSSATPCSALLGHYAVNASTGAVEDLDANGGDGGLVSSVEIRTLRTRFLRARCEK